MTPPDPSAKKFPDYVPPTRVHYDGAKPTTVHMRKCKLVTQVGGRTREHVFDKAAVTVGAMEDNDLVVSDDTVSRYHCRIVQEDSGYVLVDLGSTNGTLVNGRRATEQELVDGSTVRIGNTTMTLRLADEPMAQPPSSGW